MQPSAVREPEERLRLLYEVNRQLSSFVSLDELVRYSTRRARELFDADGCALLLLDGDRRELYFPVASQRESRRDTEAQLGEIRFSAERGIAGWVLAHGESVFVDDVRHDPRFYGAVDAQTNMVTRSILCAPLRTRSGTIGVIEVVNPATAAARDDLDFLEALAGDIAVAHENARLYEQLRGEIVNLRQVLRLIGIALMGIGAVCSAGALLVHLGRALPLGEIFAHPMMDGGLLAIAVGLILAAVAQGWLAPRTRHTA